MATQLTLSDKIMIEQSLQKDETFASIGRKLKRTASTISREVKKYRVFVEPFPAEGMNDCIKRFSCIRNNICEDVGAHGCVWERCKSCSEHDCRLLCAVYDSMHCSKLDKAPYVCSGCPEQKRCKRNHAYYSAHRANAEHKSALRDAHRGVRLTPEELIQLGQLLEPLVAKGQSLNHIFAAHAEELGVSERTLYRYIDGNAFKIRNIDLLKKVAYRVRRPKRILTRMEYRYRKGRSYEDFKSFLDANPGMPVVEMDTVKGRRGKGKVFLTMIFRETDFMLVFLMPDGTQKSVLNVLDNLTALLGATLFHKLFPVILTDNGVEFKDPQAMEHAPNGYLRTRVFYCDPQVSWQTPQVEKNHVFIRRILPKGTSFDNLTQQDVKLLVCHMNSVVREQYENLTPFQLMLEKEHKKLLQALQLTPIPPDDVVLKPELLKK